MSTAIRDIQDLFRVLQDYPEHEEELRRRLVGEELLALPGRFNRFEARMERFVEEQLQFNADQRQFNAEQLQFNAERQFNADKFNDGVRQDLAEVRQDVAEVRQDVAEVRQDVDGLRQDMAEVRQDVDGLRQDVDIMRRDLDVVRRDVDVVRQDMGGLRQDVDVVRQDMGGLRQDMGRFRGAHALDAAIRRSLTMALRMGLHRERVLKDEDLLAMAKAANAPDISAGDIESFINADLVMETTDADGQTVYVAVEVSFTANRRDTRRAIRNAEFITRFTGAPARPAVASARNDPEIADVIDAGQVYWHEIRDDDLEPG